MEIRYFPMLATENRLDAYQFYVSVGRETASLLIATVRAVPWREHADETVENLPIIQNAEQLWVRSYPVIADIHRPDRHHGASD